MYDLYQRQQIRRTRQSMVAGQQAESARHRAQSDEIHQLEQRLERLRLATESMWNLICRTTGLTDEHLRHAMAELDAVDGTVDGTRSTRPTRCACGAMVNPRSSVCAFCGAEPEQRSVFDRI